MGRLVFKTLIFAVCIALFPLFAYQDASAAEVPRMTKEEVKKVLNNPKFTIIDVRRKIEWRLTKKKIKGAHWEDPDDVENWASKYPLNKTIILYCA